MKSTSRSNGKGATINIVVGAQPGAPQPGMLGGLSRGSIGAPPAPMPRPGLSAPPPGLAGAPPAMKRGGRVMAGSGSGLGRLQKRGR